MDSLSKKYEKFVKFLKDQSVFISASRHYPTDDSHAYTVEIGDFNALSLTRESDIRKVCERLKKEKIIFGFDLKRKPLQNYNEYPVYDPSDMVFLIKAVDLYFDEEDLRQFDHTKQESNVLIDEKNGLFVYKKIKIKFRRNSKQMNFLKLLNKHKGELVNFIEFASLLMTRPVEGAIPAAVKKNIYDNFFIIKDKLKKHKIPESIFLETNDGFGLK